MNKKKFKYKTKEQLKEIADIVKNSETDEAALAFLQDTLEDDFPDLDLGRMDLHEASKVLSGGETKKKSNGSLMENLNVSLGKFIENQEKNHNKRKKAKRKRRRRK